jgi:hypothetical protein
VPAARAQDDDLAPACLRRPAGYRGRAPERGDGLGIGISGHHVGAEEIQHEPVVLGEVRISAPAIERDGDGRW